MDATYSQLPHSIDGLPRPGLRSSYAGPPPNRLSLLSADSNGPPPSYNTRAEPQLVETTPPRKPHKRFLAIACCTTLLLQIGALVLALLLLLAGTSRAPFTYGKASHAAILLQDYNILDIPIKYPFLCAEDQIQYECEPRWSVKVYLDGVWAYEEVQGDYEPVHLLQKGMGNIFNLTDALTIMDETLYLKGQGFNRSYNVPTEPTQYIRAMTPLTLRVPIVLLIVGMSLAFPLLVIWAWERCTSNRHNRAKTIQRISILATLVTMFACFLAAGVYLQITASKACEQVRGNTTYVSGRQWEASFSGKFQGMMAGVVVLQLAALITFVLHAWIEKRISKRDTETEDSIEEVPAKPLKRSSKAVAVKTEPAPPDYAMTPTDLEVIRMTEIMTLREIHSRRSSISEISQISRLSRTYTHT
ncbi:hypothetical protein B0J11DRAFT_286550 [Dendryphion nanum]|uniref:Uncharacterized protein n=1 Tax=Dendryphion nanum TaxID=256645 RepID=A0A9P9DWP5_9PLEO|nr:hypothetical protein B0J11DRAFT_286550 [Dendryphion nanum]